MNDKTAYKNIILFGIIFLALLPFMIGAYQPYPQDNVVDGNYRGGNAHSIGGNNGDGNANPIDDENTDANQSDGGESGDLFQSDSSVEQIPLSGYPSVIFIVSPEPTGRYTFTTTAILCHTVCIGDGWYELQGMNYGWADPDHLYYTVYARGNDDGIQYIAVKEYIFGEETGNTIYVREVIGVGKS